jgi:regulation of enolase protein 1 (concanavalin A-like superfamily)/DNA-binding CsgD family transcriptional regulator
MADSEDAQWILEVLSALHSPDTALVKDLLEHMARLRAANAKAINSPAIVPGIPPQLPLPKLGVGNKQQDIGIPIKSAAIYSRLREGWKRVKDLPPCLQQCRFLKETSFFCIQSEIIADPLSAEESTPLTLERAREYSHRALEIATQLGDLLEMAEACYLLTIHYKLCTDYARAFQYCDRSIALAERIGNLHLQNQAYSNKEELFTLTGADVFEWIKLLKRLAEIAQKLGKTRSLIGTRCHLARLQISLENLEEAEEELQRALAVSKISDDEGEKIVIGHHLYGFYSFLHYKRGQLKAAVEDGKKAVCLNIQSGECREDFLWDDLAWLEHLYRHTGQEEDFKALCQSLTPRKALGLRQWYLTRSRAECTCWDQIEDFNHDSLVPPWRWADPLHKGAYSFDHSLEITPVTGAGFYSNVYAPRLMLPIEGDFTFETDISYRVDLRRAGGILVYQDDNTLIRYGAGIQFDGEITLTVKSPTQGFFVIGRGLLEAQCLTLRLERQGNLFKTFCSDGKEWYSCGEAEVAMRPRVEVGVFAECAYRHLSLVRCTAESVRFAAVRVKQG